MIDESFNIPLFDPDPVNVASKLAAFAAEHSHDTSNAVTLSGDGWNSSGECIGAEASCTRCHAFLLLDTTAVIAQQGWRIAFGERPWP